MKEDTENYRKQYYEGTFSRTSPDSQRMQNSLNELLSHQRSGRLLEIGCGKGNFLTLARRHFDVTGIDVSRYAVQAAYPGLKKKIHYGNIEVDPLNARHYDAIAAFNVLEHLQRPGPVIQKIYDGLRSRGVLIGSVPLNHGFLGSIHTLLSGLFDRTHISVYTPSEWKRLFDEAGFHTVQFFGEFLIGKNRSLHVRHRLWNQLSFNLMFVCIK